ncbi:type VI secretion system lipoprotein TssJ [Aggregatibacter actinomycetemcomitans]|uniref:type VI secretion system lipoprotein TssJ n=1 Tax=Aggregatibacter actinomycetemcomitans TaxID=714 RepID=UPI00197B4566|nr:type VI secretion system lipoprotein TssJ [Aggregatibacter actinomycetemcomitans]MBN6073736.1 type VI secretion system lipoprotein TssJ [Aggregatibacter actinomycetemcomitans]MBN6078175.1 type VI secretion system lipoprotein TssJ [Aggregatibacter actinomycetemcomitans]
MFYTNLNLASKLISILLLALLLSSCQTMNKIGKVIQDPNIQVGGPLDQPSTVQISLLAETNINQNENGQPSPIELKLVYLGEDSKLLSAYYEQLSMENLSDVLGKNYIDHQDYTLLPSQYKALPQVKLKEENNYFGVIAYYSDSGNTEWKKVVTLKGVGHKYHILVHVKENEVDIRKDEE